MTALLMVMIEILVICGNANSCRPIGRVPGTIFPSWLGLRSISLGNTPKWNPWIDFHGLSLLQHMNITSFSTKETQTKRGRNFTFYGSALPKETSQQYIDCVWNALPGGPMRPFPTVNPGAFSGQRQG